MRTNAARALARQQFLEDIVNRVEHNGRLKISQHALCFMDEEPRHFIAEFVMRARELATRGRDLEKPGTFMDELEKLCQQRGWSMIQNHVDETIEVVDFYRLQVKR